MVSSILEQRNLRGGHASMQQRKASNPLSSVWVEASAGTGKTKVLSDRVLRLLLNGVRPERILCLTYTKAAAVEMNSRIAGRLSRWAVLGDEELYKELESLLGNVPSDFREFANLEAVARKLFAVLLDTPGGMKIQTIHGFCQEILKRFPLEAKISPYFEVMDDRTANEALAEIKAGLIRYVEFNPNSDIAQALAFLTKNVSEYSFPKIMNSITESRNKISKLFAKHGNSSNIIKELASSLGVDDGDSRDGLLAKFFENIDEAAIKNIMQAWFNGSATNQKSAEILSNILSSKNKIDLYDEYKNLFLKADGNIRESCGTKDTIKYFPNLMEVFGNEGERILCLETKFQAINVFLSTKAVLLLANDLIKGYNDYKTKFSKMDYEDLIVLTNSLLENKSVADWVLFKLDGGIDHILLDEAQDTSPNQWEIVKSITQDFFSGKGKSDIARTIFVVGDRKQSIYSFQGADPREFESSHKYFASKAQNFENVKLEVSFRSAPAVLDLVNNVFADEMVRKGVVSDDEDAIHQPFRMGDAGRVEIWPIVEALAQDEEEGYVHPIKRKNKESSSSLLAKEIAQNIKNMVDSGEVLDSKNRPVQYRDFLILVQRRNIFVEELVRECKNINVSVAGVDKIKLLEQISVQDLISFANFLLLPRDDLSLATILKSPIFGLDDMDLFALCYNRGSSSLWQKLGLSEKYLDIYTLLKELLNKSDFLRPFELYSHILNKMEGRKKFIERMGFEVVDGLEEFMNLTLQFEKEHAPTLQGFISWITKDDVEIKREQEQSDIDAIRIMTVHGSKGLQAPIVVLPDTARVASSKKEAAMLWDDLFYYPLSSKDYNYKCLEINARDNSLSLEEYRRLLYVALTRAEDRLCVCGYASKGKVSDDSWYSILSKKFEELGSVDDLGKISYQSSQQFEVKAKREQKSKEVSLPNFGWMKTPAPIESLTSRPFMPSVDEEENAVALVSPIGDKGESRYKRGLIIHKLLQFLPDTKMENRKQIIEEFLEKNAPDIYDKNRIIKEVLRLFEDERFSILFGKNSRVEVPIIGEIDGRIVSAQLDRIVILDDKVMIVDFKTNRPAASALEDVPKVYVKQLATYKKLLMKIYPNKAIETYILWSDTAELMLIS